MNLRVSHKGVPACAEGLGREGLCCRVMSELLFLQWKVIFSVVLQWNPQNNLWATECLAWGRGFAGCHPALRTHESPPLCGHVYRLARWPRSSCHSLPFPQRRWSWEEEDRENKTHDLTKRRVFFNVRNCMNLQHWTQQSWTMKLKSSSVLSALNIYDAGTVPSIRMAKSASNDKKNSN